MEGRKKGSKDSRVAKSPTSSKVRRRPVVNPSGRRPLVATSKWIARATSSPAEPASNSDAVAQQQAEAIADDNQRRMRALLKALLSRMSEEPSPAPSTSRAVETAPPTTTSETPTSGENVQTVLPDVATSRQTGYFCFMFGDIKF
jgi:hypothetical protein